jgi:hypothetical protein
MDQARLTYHLSVTLPGILQVGRMLGEFIVSDRGVHCLGVNRVSLVIPVWV